METLEEKQNNDELPALKKIPFFQSIEHLHAYNKRVAEVCHIIGVSQVQNYYNNKDRYYKQVLPKKEQRYEAVAELQKQKRKHLENKHKQLKKKNSDNLNKMESILAQKKELIKRKQQKLMEESFQRKQVYIKALDNSFHHSQDKRQHLKQRKDKQMQRSLMLLNQNQNKLNAANARRNQFLTEIKQILKLKNEEALQMKQNCKMIESAKESVSLKKIIKKYQDSNMYLTRMDFGVTKKIEDKKKDDQKQRQKHFRKRSNVQKIKQKQYQQLLKKQQQKIQKANYQRDRKLENVSQNIDSKRKLKQKQLLFNTFYLHQREEKQVLNIHKKQYSSQFFLTTLKCQKERVHHQNLYDSMQSTFRS